MTALRNITAETIGAMPLCQAVSKKSQVFINSISVWLALKKRRNIATLVTRYTDQQQNLVTAYSASIRAH